MLVQDGMLASCGWWRWEGPRQGYNFTSGSDLMRPHGAPVRRQLRCHSHTLCVTNFTDTHCMVPTGFTASLLHVRGMLALDLACLLRSWWQVLRTQRRPDDFIDLG